ncbi:MAG: glycosyltransferase [Bryobacteraceae bacterium]
MTRLTSIERPDDVISPATTPPRLLLSAYQCGPGMGSVSQIGWEWYSRLARKTRVTLVTHVRNRPALTAAGAPLEGTEIIYIDTEWFAGPLYRLATRLFPKSQHSVFLLSSLDFYVYDAAVLSLLRRRLAEGENWDAVHAVTPVSPVAATRLHRLGPPLIVGPWNGGLRSPDCFAEILKGDSVWLYPLRNLGLLADLWFGSTRGAAHILTATRATLESIPKRCRPRCYNMLENGVDLDRFHASPWPAPPGDGRPLRILFTGRLVPFKGLGMLLSAVARVRTEFPVELTIVGEGPMKAEWQDLAARLGLSAAVSFAGAATLDQVAGHMRHAHVFCLPSVRESGGAVLIEAMASGRPVIAVAYGGPAELVDEEVGRGIEPVNTASVTDGLADALRDVVRRPDIWRARGEQGRRRAESCFGWDAKIDEAMSLYGRMTR